MGVFANRSLKANEILHQTSNDYFSVIYRRYWKEVCGYCFKYDRGLDFKCKDNNVGVAFCSADCQDHYKTSLNEDIYEFLQNVESFCRKRKQIKCNISHDHPESNLTIDDENVDQVWKYSQDILDDLIQIDKNYNLNKKQRKLITDIQLKGLEIFDEDCDCDIDSIKVLTNYIVTNVIESNTVQNALDLSVTLQPYINYRMLQQQSKHYLAICSLLPPQLTPYILSTKNISKLLAVDRSNSFGIWSGSSTSPELQSEERSELLGSMLVPVLSRFNHSCQPSVSKIRHNRTWKFITTQNIDEGSELHITYLGGEEKYLNFNERRHKLLTGWGFVCQCIKCLKESLDYQ